VLLALVLLVGPPLGHALFPPPADAGFWPFYVADEAIRPEPVEHARYLLALLGPLIVAGGAAALAGRQLGDRLNRVLGAGGRVLLAAFVLVCVAYQETHVYSAAVTEEPAAAKHVYFTPATLAMAVALGLLAAWTLTRRELSARAARLLRETPRTRAIAIAIAAAYVLLWLSSAFNTDATLTTVNVNISENVPFWTDEAFSILDGHAPLVDFHAQYGHLWAYVAAGALWLFGATFATYALTMLAGTAAALAAVFATLRRVAGGAPAALALFLPFVATSFFMERGPLADRYGPAGLFSLFPMRYAGPFLLLWLVARRTARTTSAPPIPLFAVAGLVAINNVEFGVPALGATFAALLADRRRWSRRGLARLVGAALAGLACAVVIVALLTLAVAGSLPHLGMLETFPRIYAIDGFGLLPMPPLGLHLVVYVTFAAALVLAVVRALSRDGDGDGVLTSTLAWSGVFGLGAGAYFAGRSHPEVLVDLFSAWALALSLLAVVVVRAIQLRPVRRPRLVELLVLAGLGAAACSIAQIPTPWSQLARLEQTPYPSKRVEMTRTIGMLTRRGEAVAMVMPDGHRIAYELGLDDVTPYANLGSMMTRPQWSEMLVALRRARGRTIIVPRTDLHPQQARFLVRAGYRPFFHEPQLIALSAR